MAKEKKTIIFIVEGSSDKAALENIFKKIYRRNKEIDFGFTNGDITSDPTVTIANVENGENLSGGQRQRISIARAFLRNPKILILDEATSALDSISEKKIQDSIQKLVKGRTTLIVAHRLSTIRNADRIAVIEKGNVLECGSYEELIEKKGAFYRMEKM